VFVLFFWVFGVGVLVVVFFSVVLFLGKIGLGGLRCLSVMSISGQSGAQEVRQIEISGMAVELPHS
jgi:hypothetical protein